MLIIGKKLSPRTVRRRDAAAEAPGKDSRRVLDANPSPGESARPHARPSAKPHNLALVSGFLSVMAMAHTSTIMSGF